MPSPRYIPAQPDAFADMLTNFGKNLGEGTQRNYQNAQQQDAMLQMLDAAKGAQSNEDVLRNITASSQGHNELIGPMNQNIVAARERDRAARQQLATRQAVAKSIGVPLEDIPEDADIKTVADLAQKAVQRKQNNKAIDAIAKKAGVDPEPFYDQKPTDVATLLRGSGASTALGKANVKSYSDIIKAGSMADDVLMDLADLDTSMVEMDKDWTLGKMISHFAPFIRSPSEGQATTETLATGLVEHFKKLFPKMTNNDLHLVQSALPSWNKSLEANQAITKIFKRQAEFVKLKKHTAEDILDANGGVLPDNFERLMDDKLGPIQDEILADLRNQCAIALGSQTKVQRPKPEDSVRFVLPNGRTMTIPKSDTAAIQKATAAQLKQV